MNKIKKAFQHLFIFPYIFKWILLIIPLALVTGSLVALFLWLLDKVTSVRYAHPQLLFLLPVAGVVIHFLYKLWGKEAEKGNNLVIDEIHNPGGGIPPVMAPLVLISTLITHMFGGSAGREGTAVQMGGSIAGLFAKWYNLIQKDRSTFLMAGIAAGFGAVFGTPVAGAVFALEVLTIGRIKYNALLPCLIASIFAHIVCISWGIHHTLYPQIPAVGSAHGWLPFQPSMLCKTLIGGIAFGLASYIFIQLSHAIKHYSNAYIPAKWLIPVMGGTIVILLAFALGTQDYLGLGVIPAAKNGVSIINSFHINGVTNWSWLWKLLFTAITLGTGFKGGEVTPLFFIGAALGNILAVITGAPIELFAALGFIAVFAGATNTPLASTILGIELFGAENVLYFAIACFTAYFFSSHRSIYSAQRMP